MFRSRLEAEGVRAFVVHEHHVGNVWYYSTALGGVKVQVGEGWQDEAKSIERRCRAGEFRSLLESEYGPLDDVQCPNCGSHEHWKRRPLLRAVLAITLSALLGAILPPIGWVYFCERCGTKYKQPPLVPNSIDKWAMILAAVVFDLVLLFGLALSVWALGTRYWFAVLLILIVLAARLTHKSGDRSNDSL